MLVACPENSVVEAKVGVEFYSKVSSSNCNLQEFLRPIVTPYELEIALQIEPNWTGRYELDFNLLLTSSPPNENGKPSAIFS